MLDRRRVCLFRSFCSFVRRVAGMPDYERHIEHLQQCHPDFPVPTEREFYEDFIRMRYEAGPTRCC